MRFGSNFTEISIFAMSVGAFLGLGFSIDYALLLVQRFREELGRGRPCATPSRQPLDTAGRAVWVSGLTVVMSLAGADPGPAAGAAQRRDRRRAGDRERAASARCCCCRRCSPGSVPSVNRWPIGRAHDERAPSLFWQRVGELSMRHPVLAMLGCVCLARAAHRAVLRMRSAMPDSRSLARDSEVRRVDEALADAARFDPGGASAIPVIVETQGSPLEPGNLRALRSLRSPRSRRCPACEGVRSAGPRPRSRRAHARSAAAQDRRPSRPPRSSRRMTDDDAALLIARQPAIRWRSPRRRRSSRRSATIPHPGLDDEGRRARPRRWSTWCTRCATTAASPRCSSRVSNFVILLGAFRSVVVPAEGRADERALARRELRPAGLGVPGRPFRGRARLRAAPTASTRRSRW